MGHVCELGLGSNRHQVLLGPRFGVLVACEKEIQNVHELVHAHILSVGIAIGVHNAITVHIKKPKIFKEMRHVKGNLTYCL